MRICACLQINTSIHVYVCVFASMGMCRCMCMFVCMSVCVLHSWNVPRQKMRELWICINTFYCISSSGLSASDLVPDKTWDWPWDKLELRSSQSTFIFRALCSSQSCLHNNNGNSIYNWWHSANKCVSLLRFRRQSRLEFCWSADVLGNNNIISC